MYDRQTETWWQQLTGTGLIGEHAGRELVRLPAAIVSWRDFRTAFPDATVLSRETGHSRPYGSNPYAGYDSSTQPFLLRSTPDPRLPAMERVLHVAAGGTERIYPFGAFTDEPVINDEGGGEPVVVMSRSGTLSALDKTRIADSRRISGSSCVRVMGHLRGAHQTGQLTCYNTGQTICS